MNKFKNIDFKIPNIEEARNIVEFYNEMGGETTFLSFVENEYPFDEKAQAKSIESMQKAPHCTMLVAYSHTEEDTQTNTRTDTQTDAQTYIQTNAQTDTQTDIQIGIQKKQNREIIGIGTIHSGDKIKSRHCGILGIVIKKSHQGQGIGKQMMEQLIAFCRSNGITKKIQLETRCDNETAVNLYKNLDFEIEGKLKNAALVDGVYHDVYVMGMLL